MSSVTAGQGTGLKLRVADGQTSFNGPRPFLVWSLHVCRNIKPLFNFDPPATLDEIRAASRQFVRKISGFNKPSKVNEAPFETAINEIAIVSERLLRSLASKSTAKNRDEEAAKARVRAEERFR